MQKRERLEHAISGGAVDRVPVALWRHWPGDDQRYADLARSTIDYQQDYDWDFVRLMPSRNFQVVDYGVQDAWLGDARGIREINKRVIKRSLDWTEIRPLAPSRGSLSQQVECLRLVDRSMEPERVPIVQTVYSPFIQAAQMGGRQKLLRDMRVRPDRLRTGLNRLTESTLRFIEALRKLPQLAGIYLVTEFASHDIMSQQEFASFVMPHLHDIISELPEHWWFNTVQVAGPAPMLDVLSNLPVQAMQWDTRIATTELSQAKSFFPGAACGGLSDRDDLLSGTPALIRSLIREALSQSESRRFILSGSGDGYVTTPISNIRAVRSIAESPA